MNMILHIRKIYASALLLLALLPLALPAADKPSLASNATGIAQGKPETASPSLPNGLYVILRQAPEEKALGPAVGKERILVNDGRFLEPSERNPVCYVAVSPDECVPFVLSGEPSRGTDDKGYLKLGLQLAPEQARSLEDFSRRNLGKSVVIIIDGQVVTAHKLKSVLTGGGIQITRCASTGCQVLFSTLKPETPHK